MKCEKCHEREASVHIRQTVNGQSTSHHFCSECAAGEAERFGLSAGLSAGISAGTAGGPGGNWMSAGKLFDEFAGQIGSLPLFGRPAGGDDRCPGCGLTAAALQQTGLLGCDRCYTHFGPYLDRLFRRIQRGDRHNGRRPARIGAAQPTEATRTGAAVAASDRAPDGAPGPALDRIAELKRQQARAVQAEDYMEAARIRDEIRALERGDKSDGEVQA